MLLQVESLTSGYVDTVDILHDVTLRVENGSITTIIGPNGSGKSTLLRSIFGLLKPRRGKVLFREQDITGFPPESLVLLGLTYVPQETSVFPRMTVRENLDMGAYTRADHDVKKDIKAILDRFPVLKDRQNELAGNLSGGQQQALEMARALMLSPDLVMLDEPSAGLDPRAQRFIFETIVQLNREGTTILMVEQNARKALSISTYGYVMNLGRNEMKGTGEAILNDEHIRVTYLGGKQPANSSYLR